MKYAKTITQYIEVDAIRVDVPARDEEERDFLKGLPLLKDGRIQLVLDLNTKKVRDWPEGRTAYIHTKVCDDHGAAARWARRQGLPILTFTRVDEPGTSLRGAGVALAPSSGSRPRASPTPRSALV